MAVARLGKSGKGIHFIDDQGNAYVSSTAYLKRLMDGKFPTGFIVLTRLPNPINPDRFPKSPVWNADDTISDEPISNANDALSQKVLKKKGEVQVQDVIL